MLEVQPELQPTEQPVRKGRGAGRPFPKGESGNPSGKAKEEDAPDGGNVTVEVMKKVLGQGKGLDKGPTEKAMRKWLDKDPKGYVQAIDAKDRLTAPSPGGASSAAPAAQEEDAGTERSVKVLEEWLRDWAKSPEAQV